MKIKDIPEYVLNPSYKMTHILVAEVEDGLFQYRRCFPTKGASTRRLNEVKRLYPHIHFEVVSIEDIKMASNIKLIFNKSDYHKGGKLCAVNQTNEMIGSLYMCPHKDGMMLYDFGIFDEKHRNKGIGRMMLKYIKSMYSNEKIYLSCRHENNRALHLYKSEGFKIICDELWFDMVYSNC